jgi:uncharacterized membrane protein YphA (DoxX/SURF4 family)
MKALLEALFGESAAAGVRYAMLVLFGLLGLDAVVRGLDKLASKGPANLGEGLIWNLGLPFPTFLGIVVMLVELIGGILLLAGVVWEATYLGRRRPSSLDGNTR